ncbi:gephyrin-like molybdotransferase Glp [Pseudonocardia spinosispora]|uniref:molybdotransferase-like divisome protein Glp n=1 Tax=Pseudonocardia spinosispora TaxID=103441 RepID=UPI0004266EAD|nr:gephyrin-like molybdotransferase Glp [Pseudonocardia spinosispora]
MRPVDEQLARVLDAAVRPAPVRVAIADAQGMLCAEEVVAQRALPGFDQAAVDGYAVRSVDLSGAGPDHPVQLPVVGEIPAGSRQPHRLQPGQAVRLVTGAPLPTLADAVVPTADTDGHPATVSIYRAVPSAAFVRRIGEDVMPGDVAVRRGSVIAAAQVGLLAAVGRERVLVHPRPRVAVLSIGDELVDVARNPGAGEVYDVNSYALAAAARDSGADAIRVGLVPRDPMRLRAAVEDHLANSEVMVICGGIGGVVGEQVLSTLGELGDLDGSRVAMHPGSVQGFGRLGRERVPTFLLPANPVSALVLFEVLVRPLIRTTLGRNDPRRRRISARLLSPLSSIPGRRGYLRGQLLREEATGDYLVQPLGTSGTQLLSALAEANCLIELAEHVTEVTVGEQVTVAFLAPRS